MEEYIKNLLSNVEPWRIEAFIGKMNDLKKSAVTNEVGDFARTAKFYAEQVLKEGGTNGQ